MTTLTLDQPEAFDPDAVRHVPAGQRQPQTGGLTLQVLAAATLIASPAIWQCLVRHAMPLNVMLERYVVIALGCWLLSEAARHWFGPAAPAQGSESAAGAGGAVAAPPVDAGASPDLLASPLDAAPAAAPVSPLDALSPSTPGEPLDPALALLSAEA